MATFGKKKHGKDKSSVGPGGTGYGIGSSGSRGRTAPSTSGPSMRTQQLAKHWENLLTQFITLVTELLPSPYANNASEQHAYDILPHASIRPLLSMSQLPELLGSLLRNDSVTDWIARSEVYYAMLALLRRMADCELTVSVLTTRQFERKDESKNCGIEEWMWGESLISWEDGEEDRAPPLYEHFKKLTRQCEAFLKGMRHMDSQGDGEDAGGVEEMSMKAVSLCGDIIVAKDDIERTMSILGDTEVLHDKGKGKQKATSYELYATSHEQLAFAHTTLEPYTAYNYSSQLTQTAQSTRRPADRLHLVKELAVMATCLPVGIWMRVDEVRNDAM
jgi:hypothetical protein